MTEKPTSSVTTPPTVKRGLVFRKETTLPIKNGPTTSGLAPRTSDKRRKKRKKLRKSSIMVCRKLEGITTIS